MGSSLVLIDNICNDDFCQLRGTPKSKILCKTSNGTWQTQGDIYEYSKFVHPRLFTSEVYRSEAHTYPTTFDAHAKGLHGIIGMAADSDAQEIETRHAALQLQA